MTAAVETGSTSRAAHRRRVTRSRAGLLLAVSAGLAIATGFEVGTSTGGTFVPPGGFVLALPFLVTGAIILWKVGSHRIGWVLLGVGLTLQITTFDSIPWLSRPWIDWIAGWGFPLLFVGFTLLFILFPDGEASNRIWRALAWLSIALVVPSVFVTEIADTSGRILGPSPFVGVFPQSISNVLAILIVLVLVASAIDLVFRMRRVSDPYERARYRPVVASLALLALVVALVVIPTAISPSLFEAIGGDAIWGFIIPVYALIPVAFVVAITRYRLFDIDRLVSRTVTYAIVATVVTGVYVVIVVVLPTVLGDSDLVTATATLAAAAAFSPVRKRVRHAVDRRFNRAAFDAEQEVSEMVSRLRSMVSIDSISIDLRQVAQSTLQPAMATVWIRGGES